MTLNDPNLVFKVTPFFDTEYLTNGYRYGHSYYRRQIGNRTQAFEWHQFQGYVIFNDLELPLTEISRSCKYLTLNMALTVQNRHYVYAENGYLVRISALLIGVILNNLERAGVVE